MNVFTWASFNIACIVSVYENVRIIIHSKSFPDGQIAGPVHQYNFEYQDVYHIVHQGGNHYSALRKIN